MTPWLRNTAFNKSKGLVHAGPFFFARLSEGQTTMDFSHLHVEFFMDAVENRNKSAEKGRPIFDDIEMIRIRVAGDPKSVLVAPANSASSVRDPVTNKRLSYADLHNAPYEAFRTGVEFRGSGTPLAELSFISVGKAEELRRLSIHTAEALAGLDGSNLQKLGMGARELKEQAETWLENAAGTADITRLAGENAALKDQMEALQEQLDQMVGKGPDNETNLPRTEHPDGRSPFEKWADQDIINWIAACGGKKPHHKCSHDTIVRLADELNAEIEKQSEAA
jgi:FtsZ-binding cell division protein ZapB